MDPGALSEVNWDFYINQNLESVRIPVPLLKEFCRRRGIPYPLDTKEEREQRMRRAAASEGAGQQAASTGEVIAGLTVAQVRQVMERHQPVADIVKALAEFEAIPEGGVQEKSEKTLRTKLGILAFNHDWAAVPVKGEDAIAGSWWQGLKPLLMPGKPGRKPKKKNNST